jgi:myosin-5
MRHFLARKKYLQTIRRIIMVQLMVRRWLTRHLYRKLKVEARSVECVKKPNKGLENKIISLQQKIEKLVKENNILKSMQHKLAELRIKDESLKGVETEAKRKTVLLNEKERESETVLISLQHERDEKVNLVNEKDCAEKERREEVERMNSENTKLKAELGELNKRIRSNEIGAEEQLKASKSKLEEYKQEIEKLTAEKYQHQRQCSVHVTMIRLKQTKESMQFEITELTAQNLNLQEKFHALSEKRREYKKQIKQPHQYWTSLRPGLNPVTSRNAVYLY